MAKALLFADLHLHAHKDSVDRLYDCLKVLEWTFEEAIENKCEHILFLGDLFHERQRIDVLNYLHTYDVFMKHMCHNPPFDLYMLVGNHDMYHKERWDVNSIRPLTAMPAVHVVDKACTLKIGGRNIDFIPHIENPIEQLKKLKKGRTDLTLLLGHMAVHGAKLNILYGTMSDVIVEYDTGMTIIDEHIFDDWQMTFLGHYHAAQKINEKVEYLGSPLELSFGEAFQEKHICILDLETLEKQYIVNDFSPKHLILTPNQIDKYDLKGNFLRVEVDDISATEMVDLKLKLIQNKVASLGFNQRDRRETDSIEIKDARSLLLDQKKMIRRWIEEKKSPLNHDKLAQVADLIVAKAGEQQK